MARDTGQFLVIKMPTINTIDVSATFWEEFECLELLAAFWVYNCNGRPWK